MIEWITEAFHPHLAIFLLSMVPIVELRGAIPLGAALGISPLPCYLLCIAGNMVPVPFILLFVKKVFVWMQRWRWSKRIADYFEARIIRRSQRLKKTTFFSLVAFVAVPLPITGAWTGSGVAALLNIPFWRAIAAALLGVAIAGTIMTAIAYGFLEVLAFLI